MVDSTTSSWISRAIFIMAGGFEDTNINIKWHKYTL
jgi:hypothetical protein